MYLWPQQEAPIFDPWGACDMARADLLLTCCAGVAGDHPLFKRTLEALIAEERAKKHTVLAEHLSRYLTDNGGPKSGSNPVSSRIYNYLLETVPNLFLRGPYPNGCREGNRMDSPRSTSEVSAFDHTAWSRVTGYCL